MTRVARSARPGVHGWGDLRDLVPDADVVVLIVPGTEETRGLVDREFLALMKDDALLVNMARGPVVVTDDLLAELRAGRLRAALDVTDPEPLPDGHPLWSAPGVIITPHVGGASRCDVAAGAPPGAVPARAVRRRQAAGQPDDRGVLTAVRPSRPWS